MFVYIIIAILLGSVLLHERKKYKERDTGGGYNFRFVLIAWIWGLSFSFIIIPWQTPDEYTHLHMIGSEMKNESFAELLLNDMPLDKGRIAFNSNEKVDVALLKGALTKRPEYSIKECMPKGISIKCVRHLPATIGILLGILFRLPTFWVLQLGEIFALTFYIWICSKAISLTSVKKEMFEIIMLLPMCIQQAASINYDAVLLPLCFLLIAYIFHIKFGVNEVVDLKNIIYIAGMLLIIAIVKLPYIVLGGIFFIIPLDKVKIRLGKQYVFTIRACIRNRIIILISIVVIVCTLFFALKANEYVRLFSATVLEAPRTKYLIKTTLETFGEHLLVSTIGQFGWLDAPLPMFYVCLLTAIIVVFSISNIYKENNNGENLHYFNFKVWDKLVMLLVSLVLFYLITIAMIGHTFLITKYGTTQINDLWIDYNEALYEIPYIGGLQGRYYIPFLLPLLLVMPNLFEIEQRKYNKTIFIIECIYFLCTSHYIVLRYW